METHQIVDGNPPHEAYAKIKPEFSTPASFARTQACQKNDWKYHKMLCKSSAGPDYRRIIVFPIDKRQPVWDWARFQGGTVGLAQPEFDRLVKRSSPAFINVSVSLNLGNKNPYLRFGRGLQLFSVGEMYKGLPCVTPNAAINQSLLHLAKPGHALPHFGPYVVAAFSSDEVGRPIVDRGIEWEDATLKDLRLVVDSIIANEDNHCIIDPDRYALKLKPNVSSVAWPALKLNCRADMERFGLQRDDAIEPVLVSSVPLSGKRQNVGIGESLGLSWAWEKASTNSSTIGPRDLLRTDQDFGFWFKTVEPMPADMTPFGLRVWLQSAFNNLQQTDHSYSGTIMLVHKKGRAIQRAHLQAVMQYKDLVWAEGIEGLDTGRLPRTPSSAFLDSSLTRQKFEAFWDTVWVNTGVPSPYTLEG
ncbi:hypothetical protein PG993_012717 [Apiospora rasikravindrae]|uniref:Uncharacterized protein n=1 Tax=Apiospora rasikravindrae TaxID=990691 RepID=A0ABR1S511_9PEZI